MKQSSFRVYLLSVILRKNEFPILIVAIFLAIFCLPIITSFAFFQLDADNFSEEIQQFMRINYAKAPRIIKAQVTAYTSIPEETDATPCIAASGYNLCSHDWENVVACNFLPFGTKIKFPELDPNKIYTVVDRMQNRFDSRFDIWMKNRQAARSFGLKYLTIEILP